MRKSHLHTPFLILPPVCVNALLLETPASAGWAGLPLGAGAWDGRCIHNRCQPAHNEQGSRVTCLLAESSTEHLRVKQCIRCSLSVMRQRAPHLSPSCPPHPARTQAWASGASPLSDHSLCWAGLSRNCHSWSLLSRGRDLIHAI